MEIRIRLGSGIARLAPAPRLELELPEGATIEELYGRLAERYPELAPVLDCTLAVLRGAQVGPDHALGHGDELALLAPVSGG